MALITNTSKTHTKFPEKGGTVVVGKKTYAVGLLWVSVSEKGKIEAEAKAAASRSGADLICIHRPARKQYGLGSKATGHKAGMAPLAPMLAAVIEGNFIAAIQVSGGYYLVAVRDSLVLSGWDRLIPDKDEALEAFHELFIDSDWHEAIAPSDWALDNTKVADLEDLLKGAKPASKLQPVSSVGLILKAAGLLIVLGGLFYGYSTYEAAQEAKLEAEAAAAAAAQAAAAREAMADHKTFKLPPMPWEGRLKGVPMIADCVDAILKAPIDVPGWTPVALSCSSDGETPPGRETWTMNLSLVRTGGTINWVGPALNKPGFRPSVSEGADGNVLVSWPVDTATVPAFKAAAASSNLRTVRGYLVPQFEEVFEPISLQDNDGLTVEAPASGPSNKKVQVLLERHLDFSFKTAQDPKDYLSILAPVPVLAAKSVRLDIASWTWTIEGTVYERMPLPKSLLPPQPRAGQKINAKHTP